MQVKGVEGEHPRKVDRIPEGVLSYLVTSEYTP